MASAPNRRVLTGRITQSVSFVYSPDRFMPVKLRGFLDFALPRLRARLGDLPNRIASPGRGKSR
jgi:hypothetical protein